MSYSSVSEVPSSVPKELRKQWMTAWNETYKETGDEGKALAAANKSVKPTEDNMRQQPIPDEMKKSIFCPLVKVDAAKREVWGVVTAEVPDRDNEICDFDSTVPYYKAVVDEMSKATDGENIFPLRAMHGLTAAGKGLAIEFRKDTKEVYMGFKVVDDAEWKKVEESVYTGFSQGGRYVKKWKDGDYVRYTAAPGEVSLVDIPCLKEAHFDYVKADGSVEVRKFASPASTDTSTTPPATQTPDPGSEQKKAAKGAKYAAIIQELLKEAIQNRAYGYMGKGMYTVGRLADICDSLKYLWLSLEYEEDGEEDPSEVPNSVKECFLNLLNALLAYTEEEVEEVSNFAENFDLGEYLAMAEVPLDLAKAKSMASLHKRAAAHHEKAAAQHEKCMKAHEEYAQTHSAAAQAEDGVDKAFHKSATAFHKTMTGHHGHLNKAHSGLAEFHHKSADMATADTAGKCLKIAGIEEDNTMSTPTEQTPVPAAQPAAVPAPAAPSVDMNEVTKAITDGLKAGFAELTKALAESLKPATPAAPAPVAPAADAPDDPIIKSFPVMAVPRTGQATTVDLSNVDLELADLCKVEGE